MATPPLGGLSTRRFLREYWQRKPLFAANALPQLPALMDRDALFALACRDDIESRLITRAGGRWGVAHGPFTRRALGRLPARNWTLLVNGVESHAAPARVLQSLFAFIPYARHDDVMISYAAPGGGVGPHFDSYDVFLLQAAGTRRWQLSAQTDLALIDGAPLKLLRRFRAQREIEATAGDLLYLPPRFSHNGIAVGGACMTWSVGLRAPSRREFAVRFLDYLHDRLLERGAGADDADDGDIYRDPDLRQGRHAAALPPGMVSDMQRMLQGLSWGRRDVARCLGEYLTEPRPGVAFSPPKRAATAARFARDARRHGVRLHLKTRLLFEDGTLFVNGESAPAGGGDRRFLRTLADRRRAVLPARGTAATLALLYPWYCAGYIETGAL